ncbi:folate family ECF transporter S component [Tissierella praeacuta]|uniref:folate family ECF transporter S component n=1 Tax=Tissierella praeacuta TaxID=43131 RepID=UPI0033414C70
MNSNKGSRLDTRTLTQSGFLVAISIVITRFLSFMVPLAGGLPALRLGFGEVPLMISGLLFGPVVGGISGIVADLIGAWAFPQGPYFPGFTLSSMLWGVISGMYGVYLRKKGEQGNPFSYKRVFFIIIICTVFISTLMNTYWLTQMMGKGFMVLLPGRILSDIIKIPVETYIITILIKQLRRTVAFDK